MLKHLMSGASLLALAVRDKDNEQGADVGDARAKLRDQLAKGVSIAAKSAEQLAAEAEGGEGDKEEDKEEDEGDDNKEEDEGDEEDEADKDDKDKVEETEEEKTAREAKEASEARARRKDDRVQKRIDKAVAAQRVAEDEVAKLKAQLDANPDKKLTEEEVQARAEAIAAKKVADADMVRLQEDFNKSCNKLQAEAIKLDKEFDAKVGAMAADLGPIPSRIIGVLSDLDNGAEVLKFMVDDIDEAEKLYDLKDKPERLAIALVRIADKLADAKKPKPKPLSKVPNPVKPVNGHRVQSSALTEADTKDMDSYVRKRKAQREAQLKERGY